MLNPDKKFEAQDKEEYFLKKKGIRISQNIETEGGGPRREGKPQRVEGGQGRGGDPKKNLNTLEEQPRRPFGLAGSTPGTLFDRS
jgi:hypothetical protein